jgi:hypothetical protein
MKIFAIGDLHLSFSEKVEKPMDIFGGQWVGHTEKLYKNWCETVGCDDLVIICGDISWGLRLDEAEADFQWIKKLPGKKVLFKGNHDLWWQSAGKLNKLYGDENMVFIQNTAYMIQSTKEKIAICGSRGWICPGDEDFSEEDKKIYERELLRLRMSLDDAKRQGADKIIGVLHFPPTNDKLQFSGFTELMTEYNVDTCVYGHLHGNDAFKNGLQGIFNKVRYELVSLDYIEAKPKEVIY